MGSLETGSDGSTWVATSVHDVTPVVMLCLVQQGLDSGLCKAPGTGVKGLLLRPDDVLGVGVRVKVLLQLLPWEGVQLLNTGDGNICEAASLTLIHQRSVDLTCAKNDTLDLLVRTNLTGLVRRVLDDPFEVRVTGEFLDIRASHRVAEQRLREEEDERLTELAVHLATQQMEVVRRFRAVGDLDIAVLVLTVKLLRRREDAGILVDELQITLHATRRVLRTLTVVTVGQAHDKTRTLEPLDFSRSNKLVNNDLGSVGKITKLSFPHDKCVGRRKRVTILESETRVC